MVNKVEERPAYRFFHRKTEGLGPCWIQKSPASLPVHSENDIFQAVDQCAVLALAARNFFRHALALGNVRSDRDELIRVAALVQKWNDGGVDPVMMSCFRGAANFAMPDLAV